MRRARKLEVPVRETSDVIMPRELGVKLNLGTLWALPGAASCKMMQSCHSNTTTVGHSCTEDLVIEARCQACNSNGNVQK